MIDSTRIGNRKVPVDIKAHDLMASELHYESSTRPCDNPKLNFALIRKTKPHEVVHTYNNALHKF